MSHITRLAVDITDGDMLKEALMALGYKVDSGKCHVKDYYGNKENVDISVDSGKFGFSKNETGQYTYVGDLYGTGLKEKKLIDSIKMEYKLVDVKKKLSAKRYPYKINRTDSRIMVEVTV